MENTTRIPVMGKGKEKLRIASARFSGEFIGGCVIDDDCGYHGLGVAQGGMIDTPNGDWYAFMFVIDVLGRAPAS